MGPSRRAVFGLAVGALFAAEDKALAQTLTFEVGQVWSLKAPMAPSARVRIGRIENNGEVIHISVWGQPVPDELPVPNPFMMSHLPISRDALTASVDSIVSDAAPSDLEFEEGYGVWSQNHGGVFTITVAEILDAVLQTLPGRDTSHK
jgi:hypothetical protein